LGLKYRWTGKMMGLPMDFTVEVTKWIPGKEKVWQTIGEPKLIIYSSYRMQLLIVPALYGCDATLSISYERPNGFFSRILSFLFADWYGKWCLKNMLGDARKSLALKTNECEHSKTKRHEVGS
jgi:hypothetical protein